MQACACIEFLATLINLYNISFTVWHLQAQRTTNWIEKRTFQPSFDNERKFAKIKLLLDG